MAKEADSGVKAKRQNRPGAADYRNVGVTMPRWAMLANVILLVTLLGASVAFVAVMGSLPRIHGTHPVKGINLKTTITRDGNGLVSIKAQSVHDAYFAMGWVHAQDRLWQMEASRRLGAGRLAEVVGPAGLASDRLMRTLGLYRAASQSLPALPATTRAALQSYADGVNAWMEHNTWRLPPEFTVLGFRPEPWTPADSVVWQKIMAVTLTGNWQDDILRGRLARSLDSKRLAELFPAYPSDAPVTLPGDGGKALLDGWPAALRPTPASNAWVVSGARTQSGKPLLAGDPHLGFRAPIQWYLAAVEAPGLKLAGATVPGLPFHLIGHNGSIGWSFTATQADTVDLYVEKLGPPGTYRAPDGNRPLLTRPETIKVKGAPDEVITVRETRHGPVVSDLGGDSGHGASRVLAGEGEVVAMASTALGQADTTLHALHLLNQADGWPAFIKATQQVQAPVLNILYGDTAGNIGFATAGHVPVRKSGNGMLPQRGWTVEGDWTAMIPAAKMPQSLNPKAGVLVNANNKVVGDKYPYLLTANWPEGYRAQRIRDLLGERKGLALGDMAAIQADTVSLQALELKDLLTGVEFKEERSRAAAQMLAQWDGNASADRPEPLIFAAWISRLNRAILADELKDDFAAFERIRPQVLVDILTRRRHWCDDITTPQPESCDTLIARSLDQTMAALEARWGKDVKSWRWGAAHPARFSNPVLSRLPLVGGKAEMQVPSGGDDFTVNRAAYHTEDDGTRFPQVHGAGLRVVLDLADLDASRFVIATGQSGNPLSRHHDDMLPAWSVNRLFRFGEDGKKSVLVLERGR